MLHAGFEQNNNRWINLELESSAFFMHTPRVQAPGMGPEPLQCVI